MNHGYALGPGLDSKSLARRRNGSNAGVSSSLPPRENTIIVLQLRCPVFCRWLRGHVSAQASSTPSTATWTRSGGGVVVLSLDPDVTPLLRAGHLAIFRPTLEQVGVC